MPAKMEFSESAAQELLDRSPDQLYEYLGMVQKAVEEEPEKQATFAPEVTYSDHMGPLDDLKKIGRRMFNRLNHVAYNLVCGTGEEDEEDRKKLMAALGVSATAAVTALAGILVSTLGLAAAVAGVIATLVVKRFGQPVLKEGLAAMCEVWKEHLPEEEKKEEGEE